MKNETKTGLVVAVTLAALAISGGAMFIGSGVYNIGADDHHTKFVLALIEGVLTDLGWFFFSGLPLLTLFLLFAFRMAGATRKPPVERNLTPT